MYGGQWNLGKARSSSHAYPCPFMASEGMFYVSHLPQLQFPYQVKLGARAALYLSCLCLPHRYAWALPVAVMGHTSSQIRSLFSFLLHDHD